MKISDQKLLEEMMEMLVDLRAAMAVVIDERDAALADAAAWKARCLGHTPAAKEEL